MIRIVGLAALSAAAVQAFVPSSRWTGGAAHQRAFSSAASRTAAEQTCELAEVDPESMPVMVRDPDSDRAIECWLDSLATVREGAGDAEGGKYAIVYPCDVPVALAKTSGCFDDVDDDDDDDAAFIEGTPSERPDDEELELLDTDGPEMDVLFDVAAGVVSQAYDGEVEIVRSASYLTLQGDVDFLEEDDDEARAARADGGDDDEGNDLEPLLAFEHKGQEWELLRFVDPIMLLAKIVAPAEDAAEPSYELLSEEESDRVMPVVEAQILATLED